MSKIAVLFAPGFEESEGLTIVDILRRANLEALSVGVGGNEITGAHGITLRTDTTVDAVAEAELDMVVAPGGYGGVEAMMKSEAVISLFRTMGAAGKWTCAICAGPRVLDKAGLLEGVEYSCYPGQEQHVPGGRHRDALVVRDGKVITAPGPAAVYAFSYALVDALGGDSLAVKNRMVYFNAFDESKRSQPVIALGPARDKPKVAVLMKEGFEEGETFSIVDILRRVGVECDSFYFDEPWVKGMHGMYLKADKPFAGGLEDYDAVVLPGGRPGGANLAADPEVLGLLRRWNGLEGKYLCALCSGTTVLAAAGVIEGKRMTGYTGYAEKLPGAVFVEQVAVADQNLVTSQGPATGYPFAFKLAETLGTDTTEVRERLMYAFVGGK